MRLNRNGRNADADGGAVKGSMPEVATAPSSFSNNAWIERSGVERRSGADKRCEAGRLYFFHGGRERRRAEDRRQTAERRDGWLQVSKWCSVCVFDPGR